MTVLGLTGGIDATHENVYDFPFDFIHDSAAVLVRDGRVLAGIESERLNRIKHTNKTWGPAARFCLEQAGVTLGEVDAFAYYATEDYCDRLLQHLYLQNFGLGTLLTGRTMIAEGLKREFGEAVDPGKIRFVHHHHAHAVAAYAQSGYDRALVLTLDGQGEKIAGMVFDAEGGKMTMLRSMPEEHSLGWLYRDVIRFLGYEMFDEYKVMGMAPYGKPERHRKLFSTFYELLPEGGYRLHLERVAALHGYVRPRRKGQPFSQNQQDVAAALQEALETIAVHVARHFQQATGHTKLCLAGGVAHNCSMNGRLVYERVFERIFVHPAAHDAGCAVGAALAVNLLERPGTKAAPIDHVYWGTDMGDDAAIERELRGWSGLVTFEKRADIVAHAARLMAEGKVFGWVQGRSEFGPRALGHRSILADPRPAENKDIINRMVKKREAYRPFAPSVLAERVDEFFVLPGGQKDFPFMTFVVDVQPDKRALLGAITHVDGTARVQTVARASSPRYWELIHAFGEITGVPMLLNTSFNNHAEPVVDSVREAIACFLTTELHHLAIGDFFVSKQNVEPTDDALLALAVTLPENLALRRERKRSADGAQWETSCAATFTQHRGKSATLSETMAAVLERADGTASVGALAERAGAGRTAQARAELAAELRELWTNRVVVLRPAS